MRQEWLIESAAEFRSVLDDEWLAEPLRQPLTHQARDNVGRAASGDWHATSASKMKFTRLLYT